MCLRNYAIGIGATAAVVALGYLGYSQHQLSKEVQASNQNVAALAQLTHNNANNSTSPAVDSALLAAAVRESMEQIENEKAMAVIQGKINNYSLASDDIADGTRIYGNPNARFSLATFSDTECPFCKRFHPTPKKIIEDSDGQVNWVFKHLPLGFHNPAAEVQAVAAECVGEIKGNRMFWAFLQDLFDYSGANGQGVNNINDIVSSYGVTANQFNECMSNNAMRFKVQKNVEEAQKLGIRGTPATVVTDNETGRSIVLSGAQPAESFLTAIRRLTSANDQSTTE